MRPRLALFAALFVLVFPATLLADTYQYQFSVVLPGFNDNAQFTFDTDALITSQTTVTPTSCSYNPGGGVIDCDSIVADLFDDGGAFYLQPPDPWEDSEEIFTGLSLTDLGVTQTDGIETLTVTDLSSVAATPEPSSILLLGTGMLFLAGFARRRFTRVAVPQNSSV